MGVSPVRIVMIEVPGDERLELIRDPQTYPNDVLVVPRNANVAVVANSIAHLKQIRRRDGEPVRFMRTPLKSTLFRQSWSASDSARSLRILVQLRAADDIHIPGIGVGRISDIALPSSEILRRSKSDEHD